MKKNLLLGLAAILILLGGMCFLDFFLVGRFDLPVFARPAYTVDASGTGTYQGLGYSFEIEGNYAPGQENPGVVRYEGYLIGLQVAAGIRD